MRKLSLVLTLLFAAACGGAPDPAADSSSAAVGAAPACAAKADDGAHPVCLAAGDLVVTCTGGYDPGSVLGPDQFCFGPIDSSGADPQIYCCHDKPSTSAKCDLGVPAPAGMCDAEHPKLVTCDYPVSSASADQVPPLVDQGAKRGFVWCVR